MIQRIQTLYLSLALVISIIIYIYSFETLSSTLISKSHFFLISATILIFTILLYKKRTLQSFICLSLFILNLIVLLFLSHLFINSLYLDLGIVLPTLILIQQMSNFLSQ